MCINPLSALDVTRGIRSIIINNYEFVILKLSAVHSLFVNLFWVALPLCKYSIKVA